MAPSHDVFFSAGSLYRRLIDDLIEPDVRERTQRLGTAPLTKARHPWFPAIAIGLEKVALYSKAIHSDLAGAISPAARRCSPIRCGWCASGITWSCSPAWALPRRCGRRAGRSSPTWALP